MLVDDDKSILEMLGSVLSLEGYKISLCQDGVEAVKRALEEKPDLIILDVMMPGKSGIDVMLEIRANPDTKEIPILFLSAIGDESIVVKGLKGADDYVVKPFKMLEFQERIKNILKRSKAQQLHAPPGKESIDRLPVRIGNETLLFPYKEIYFAEAAGKYCYIHTRNRRFLAGYSIGDLDEKLCPSGDFLRIHRSYVINVDRVRKMTRDSKKNNLVVMADDEHSELRISESYLSKVKNRLGV
ncbi:MAG: response regulator [Actinobacteria bacterium]|nr:response regulator [Actinomycetota bacterium]